MVCTVVSFRATNSDSWSFCSADRAQHRSGTIVLKIIYCIRRRQGLSREQFLSHWLDVHGPIVLRHQETLRIARYQQTTPLEHDFSVRVERRGVLQPAYDGVAELYWANDADFRHAFTDQEALRIQKILADDERNFVDHAGSARWISREIVVIPGAPTP